MKRRRATNSRGVNNVILSVHGKHHGLVVENGVYISRIAPGSVAAREGSIAVGDRLLAVSNHYLKYFNSTFYVLLARFKFIMY